MTGFLLIDKQPNWTSFDICSKTKTIFNIKKVGHTGTLDPFATGLLIIALGKCTKLIPYLEKAKKTYVTTIEFGKTSETLDPESEITTIPYPDTPPSKTELEKILKDNFYGNIEQIPPQFSAIKINGKRSYELARKGETVKLSIRQTTILHTEILNYEFPLLKIKLEVAAGFYVRSFARDLAQKLGTKGMCTELRRTMVENISVNDAEQIEAVTNPIDPKFIIPLPHISIPTGRIQDFMSGRAFPYSGEEQAKYLVLCGKKTFGVGEIVCGNLQPRVVI